MYASDKMEQKMSPSSVQTCSLFICGLIEYLPQSIEDSRRLKGTQWTSGNLRLQGPKMDSEVHGIERFATFLRDEVEFSLLEAEVREKIIQFLDEVSQHIANSHMLMRPVFFLI